MEFELANTQEKLLAAVTGQQRVKQYACHVLVCAVEEQRGPLTIFFRTWCSFCATGKEKRRRRLAVCMSLQTFVEGNDLSFMRTLFALWSGLVHKKEEEEVETLLAMELVKSQR